MPVLKQLVSAILHKVEDRDLLGKAFDCISVLASSVGHTVFLSEAEGILQALVQAASSPNLPKDDPVQEYLVIASERICTTLGADFAPFVPHLLPFVLSKVTCVSEDLSKQQNEQVLLMNTSEIEDLQNALSCTYTFAEKLGGHFGPFVAQTAQVVVPIFAFLVTEGLRDLVFDLWGQLCACARDGGQPGVVVELCSEFLRRMLPMLQDSNPDPAALKSRVFGVARCLGKAGPGVLTQPQVAHLSQLSLALISASFDRRASLRKDNGMGADNEQDLDETRSSSGSSSDQEEQEESDEEEMLRTAAVTLATALMRHQPAEFASEGLAAFMSVTQTLLQPLNRDCDRQLALHMLSGICAHAGELPAADWPSLMPQVLLDTQDPTPGVRRSAFYAASTAGRLPAFAPFATEAARRAVAAVARARGGGEEGSVKSGRVAQGAADNALSVMAEVLLHHPDSVGDLQAQSALWTIWLAGLPCQEDAAESMRNSKVLLQAVEQSNLALLGEGRCNMGRIVALLVEACDPKVVDVETSVRICSLLRNLDQSQPHLHAEALPPKIRKRLHHLVGLPDAAVPPAA